MGMGQDLKKAATRKLRIMKTRIALAGLFLLNWLCIARADTLFTNPFIVVSPTTLDFGAVREREFATNYFLVENVGSGTLVGKAAVPPPFKILSGGTYKLKRNAAQVVAIVYTPKGPPTNTQVVTFTGGASEVKATVTGRLSTKPRPYHLKRK
jgi:hypothetical protein